MPPTLFARDDEAAPASRDRTVHPESNAAARQEAVDALGTMAEGAGVGPDDAQFILAESFKQQSPPALSKEAVERVNGHAADGWEQEHPPQGEPASAPSKNHFKLEMLDDIVLTDDPVELVRGILPMGPALGVVFGPPKSLKSFLLTHIGLHIADNREFCGRAVQGGAVVYVTPEGIRGAKRRLIASRRELGIEGHAVPFALVSVMPNLGAGPEDRITLQQEVTEALKHIGVPLRVIVIDTMRRAMPGKSENEQKDISIVVDNCEALARAFNCLVILVHHSPRSDDNRGSGSNALDAAADLMIGVTRDEATGRARATVVRYKDGEEGDTWEFELRRAEIGTDRQGNPIVSCYVDVTVEPERRTAPKPAKDKPSAAQQRIYDILVDAVAEAGVSGLAGAAAPPSMRAITYATLKAHAKKQGWWDESDKKTDHSSQTRFKARLNELAGKHVIGLTAEYVWLAAGRGRTM